MAEKDCATAMDTTERLSESFRELLHAAPEAMLLATWRGKILRLNRAAEDLFGYPSNELAGRSIEVLVPSRFRDEQREHLRACAKNPRPRSMGAGRDLFAVRKDGREFPVELDLVAVEGAQGRLAICVVRDNSLHQQHDCELQEQSRQLAEHQRSLKAVAAKLVLAEESERRRIAIGLHDDVGQALAATMILLGELLEKASPGDHESSARQAQRLVGDAIRSIRVLTFELASPALYEVGLEAALQSTCEHAEQESGIRFLAPSGLPSRAIPEATRVVLYRVGRELVRNIVKHSKARTAKVSLSHSADRIRLTVEDDGRGFDASKGLAAPDPQAGIGLLSIAQQLDHIGGKLEIESSAGRGTRAVAVVLLDPEGLGT